MGPWLLAAGVIMVFAGVFMRPKEGSREWTFFDLFAGATALGKFISIAGIVLTLVGGRMYSHGGSLALPSRKADCARNLSKIECVKDQFMIGNNLKPGTALTPAQVQQLGVFMPGGWGQCRCPAGGTYDVGKLGEAPRCSVHGGQAGR